MRLAAAAFAALLLASGCLSAQHAGSPPTAAADVLAAAPSLSGCTGLNAFPLVDQAVVARAVPSNWTMTRPQGMAVAGLATLRLFVSHCAEGSLAVLATPANTDEASKGKHPNPDIMVQAFADGDALAAWLVRQGVPTAKADIAVAPSALDVTVAGQRAVHVDVTQAGPPGAGSAYAEPYVATQAGLHWFWGWENETRAPAAYRTAFGPASIVGSARVVDYNPGSWWTGYGLALREGTPPASGS